jgi:hypothetical protein
MWLGRINFFNRLMSSRLLGYAGAIWNTLACGSRRRQLRVGDRAEFVRGDMCDDRGVAGGVRDIPLGVPPKKRSRAP